MTQNTPVITFNENEIFRDYYLDSNNLYYKLFKSLPNINYMDSIDGAKAYAQFLKLYKLKIVDTFQYKYYMQSKKKFNFDRTIIVLNNQCLVVFDEDYISILHPGKYATEAFVDAIANLAIQFKEKTRKQALEVNLIVNGSHGMELKSMEIKPTKLNLNLFYEDDFIEVDEIIRKRLNKKQDKGIVLLHGLPGTGKTTYLRYLISKIKKRVLFVSPEIANNLMHPSFVQLLIDNPNTVLIIEDAENLIMDRRYNKGGSVSNLLNISDGLLADFLNVQIICTFNSEVSFIDDALLRKGRLIARYEFGKLCIEKAQLLSNYLGHKQTIVEPKTLTEIANPDAKNFEIEKNPGIGFRQHTLQLNN